MFEDWRGFAAFLSEETIEADLYAMPDAPWADKQREALRWIDANAAAGDLDEARAALRSKLGENPFAAVAEKVRGIDWDKFEGIERFFDGISERNPDPEQRERFIAYGRAVGLIDDTGEVVDHPLNEVFDKMAVIEDPRHRRGVKKLATPWQRQAGAMDEMRKLVVAKGLTPKEAAKEVVRGTAVGEHKPSRLAQLFEKKQTLRQ